MRCYFMHDGHIRAVEILSCIDDQSRIAEARELFETRGKPRGADGFEVWDGKRFVYRFPEAAGT
ncbi:MAG TPA: hypothetical protein VHZ32_02745 [Rhizomicrobium sp.]|jgi:hypothetical protein|nr:hypothetical protein [Rhizomicrobium sp.]